MPTDEEAGLRDRIGKLAAEGRHIEREAVAWQLADYMMRGPVCFNPHRRLLATRQWAPPSLNAARKARQAGHCDRSVTYVATDFEETKVGENRRITLNFRRSTSIDESSSPAGERFR